MTLLVTLAEPVLVETAAVRDRRAAEAAAADHQEQFEMIDRTARSLRADGWPPCVVAPFQQAAEIAYMAARAERRHLEEDPS